jgi:hypothetical protein
VEARAEPVLALEATARAPPVEQAALEEPVPVTDQVLGPPVPLGPPDPPVAPAAAQVAPRIVVLAGARIPPVADILAS